jgi:hypothetical protein
VIVIVVVSVIAPEVPVMVIRYVPGGTEQPTPRVSVLLPLVIGLVPNAAEMPEGRPDAESVTLPVNPPVSVTLTGTVPEPQSGMVMGGKTASVKPPAPVTVSVRVVDAVSVPDVPEMVTVELPIVATEVAVKVTTLEPVVGLVANAAVTPVGSPDAARVTLPANGLTSVTVMVSVAVLPRATDVEATDGLSVKLPVDPVTVIVNVSVLLQAAGLV